MRSIVLLLLLGCSPGGEGVGSVVGTVGTVGVAATPPERTRTNVLLVVVDDLGIADLGAYGSDLHQTPTLDRLAMEGVRFTNAYASSALCTPTRAAMVTGLHPARMHLTDWIPGRGSEGRPLQEPDWSRTLPIDVPTIGTVLEGNGYFTAWHGKWHLDGQATDHGFSAGHQDWALMWDRRPDDPKGVLQLTDEALGLVDDAAGAPFFLAVSHYAVHTPIRTGTDDVAAIEARLAERGPGHHDNARYAAMVEATDASVEVLLDGLEDRGVLDDTVVLVTSDNGGVSRVTTNIGYRDGKTSLYDGGLRVPLIAWRPGHVLPHDADTVTGSEDLLPTIAALTGSPMDGVRPDGRSIVPVLAGEALPDRTIQAHYPHYNTNPESFPGAVMRDEDGFKVVERFTPDGATLELYDLRVDPAETTDLAEEDPGRRDALAARLRDWRGTIGAQEMVPAP